MHDRLTSATLAVATGHALSLALLATGGRILAESHQPMLLGQAEQILPALAALLRPTGGAKTPIGRILVETGPGSFTGLRVGIAAARALGLAWGVPVAGLRSTLLVAAEARQRTGSSGRILVALAAPRGQIWMESLALETLASLGPPVALSLQDACAAAAAFAGPVAGSGAGLLGRPAPEGAPRAAFAASVDPSLWTLPDAVYVRVEAPRAVACA